MGKLLFSMSVSLDGFVNTPSGSLDWVLVDAELHEAFNEEARNVQAFLYGRRMYELMAAHWPTAEDDPQATPTMVDFARIWRDKPKVVFSHSLERVDHNSRLVREDAAREVTRLKAEPGMDMDVGGPTLAGSLLAAGLIDEVRLYVHPVVLGAGTPFFPPLEARTDLRMVDTRTFGSGVVLLRYEVSAPLSTGT
jgi:dihydrofolate reductase